MRLALVHGINNQNSSSQQIIDQWLAALESTLPNDAIEMIRGMQIVAPYYGDVLYEATETGHDAPEAVAQSAADPASDEAEFYREALEDLAPAVGVTESDIHAASGSTAPIEQGLPHDRRFLALLRAIEAIAPDQGRIFLRILPQAFAYLFRAHVSKLVDDIVRPAITGDSTLIVAHSLGTLTTFKLLRERDLPVCPFYFTLGSPLSVKAVQNALGPVFGRPASVGHWLNGLDPDDAVSIGRSLKNTTFGPGIDNIDDIDNGIEDPHDIRKNLSDRRIAEAIYRALQT